MPADESAGSSGESPLKRAAEACLSTLAPAEPDASASGYRANSESYGSADRAADAGDEKKNFGAAQAQRPYDR
jgi:hypothetical protein